MNLTSPIYTNTIQINKSVQYKLHTYCVIKHRITNPLNSTQINQHNNQLASSFFFALRHIMQSKDFLKPSLYTKHINTNIHIIKNALAHIYLHLHQNSYINITICICKHLSNARSSHGICDDQNNNIKPIAIFLRPNYVYPFYVLEQNKGTNIIRRSHVL